MVWLMGATEMADTESGDKAALLLISTFFLMQNQETGNRAAYILKASTATPTEPQ